MRRRLGRQAIGRLREWASSNEPTQANVRLEWGTIVMWLCGPPAPDIGSYFLDSFCGTSRNPLVSNNSMPTRIWKANRTRLISRPSLLAFGLTLLFVATAIFLMVRRTPPLVNGVMPVISVVHIQGNAAGRRQLGIFAFHDNAYIKTDQRVGLLSLASSCKQSAKEPLPDSLSIAVAKSLTAAERLQSVRNGAPYSRDSWHIRISDGGKTKCFTISNEDAEKNADFAAVTAWFRAVQAIEIPLSPAYNCGDDTDVVSHCGDN